MLTMAGSVRERAKRDSQRLMDLETAFGMAFMGVVELREPEKIYHLQPIATFQSALPGFNLTAFEDAIHSPHVAEINNSTPDFWAAMIGQMDKADIGTIKAYLRYHLLTTLHSNLPKELDDENFNFYGRALEGQP